MHLQERIIIMNKDFRKFLYHQTPLKILSFFSFCPGKIFSAKEISQQTGSSKGATNQSLRLLLAMDVILRERKGNLFLYKLNMENVILRQFKIFEILVDIQKLIKHIQPFCYQIILFGSCATGTNAMESDIDLFIKTDDKESVQKHISRFNRNVPTINAVIYDPLELLETQKTDKVFFNQVKKGIVLWEGGLAHEKF